MSPRPKICRKMCNPPVISGLTPSGKYAEDQNPVHLLLEEYESILLCDYKFLHQAAAAKMMQVSRPTFTRIYENARRKLALMLAEGRRLEIQGGSIHFDEQWFQCSECYRVFQHSDDEESILCPHCNSNKISNLNKIFMTQENRRERSGGMSKGYPDICVCPKCRHEIPHIAGVPCRTEICEKCGTRMVRKGSMHDKKE